MTVIEELIVGISEQLNRLGTNDYTVASPSIVMVKLGKDIFYCDGYWFLEDLRKIDNNDGAIDLVRKAADRTSINLSRK